MYIREQQQQKREKQETQNLIRETGWSKDASSKISNKMENNICLVSFKTDILENALIVLLIYIFKENVENDFQIWWGS